MPTMNNEITRRAPLGTVIGWIAVFAGISAVPAADSWVLSVGVLIHTSPILHTD